ncbi:MULTISPECIES: helix-turn-helix domain-containing protein [Streptomyces]|uniref:helix-turn-helix domain-containing protein n=1 Tax=Streptomyces TaxID=1883 RepID=UPI00101EAE3F|nr:helix-turn-helix transcriptional regulator [Streptomyces sp. SCA2-2]RZE98498.1 transcriptional regulator [Streptomyces sp. SCA2-2]
MSESKGGLHRPADGAAFFGKEVKELREALGLSQAQFADKLHYKQAQVSKVESGAAFASEDFATGLDRVAGTPGVYARLRVKLRGQGHPEWFIPYIALEESASGITDYSCTFLMGLLQIPEYAAAVFRAAHPRESEEQIRERVELRIRRQDVLARERPPLLWVIVHEAVLRTCVGGSAVMVAQLEHLMTSVRSPDITVQVLPYSAGASPSHLPLTLVSAKGKPHAVYTETPTHGGQVDHAAEVVAAAVGTFDRLRMAALPEQESLALLAEITKEHANEQHRSARAS